MSTTVFKIISGLNLIRYINISIITLFVSGCVSTQSNQDKSLNQLADGLLSYAKKVITTGDYIPDVPDHEISNTHKKKPDAPIAAATKSGLNKSTDKNKLNEAMTAEKTFSLNKTTKNPSRKSKPKDTGLIPRATIATYKVDEGMMTYTDEVIEARRTQVTFELPGE